FVNELQEHSRLLLEFLQVCDPHLLEEGIDNAWLVEVRQFGSQFGKRGHRAEFVPEIANRDAIDRLFQRCHLRVQRDRQEYIYPFQPSTARPRPLQPIPLGGGYDSFVDPTETKRFKRRHFELPFEAAERQLS